MFDRDRFHEIIKKKEIKKDKKIDLEKGDLAALLLAAFSIFVPIVLLFVGVFALLIWLILIVFK